MQELEHWEKRLTPYFKARLRLLGEIPLSFSDVEDMAEGVKGCIRDHGLVKATAVLTQKYPQTLITFMSAFAAYNTQRNYWQAFADRIGVDKTQLNNRGWHHQFVSLAKARGLKVFDFKDDPNPYVTSIRFQGGIPAYSLPDYFERMVLPAVERPGLSDLTPQDALKHLLLNIYLVDSPVLDFLENSGEMGEGFFAESCKLARYVLQNHGAMPPADEVDLPEYVQEAFAEHWEHREDARLHWHKPFLQAAPYAEDTVANLILPLQEVPLDLAASSLYWQVAYPGAAGREVRNCRVKRSRQSAVTEADFLAVPSPVGNIEVSLHAVASDSSATSELRRWNIPLLPEMHSKPLAVFNAEGIQLTSVRKLPAEVLYLLLPADAELLFEGQARLVETCQPQLGAWVNWKLEQWDLGQAWSLLLSRGGNPIGEVIPVQGVIAQPRLVGGRPFDFQDLETPLYTAGLPLVSIPLLAGAPLESGLAAWQVQVRSLWEAAPAVDCTVRVVENLDAVLRDGERAIFPLAHILGDQPAGTYVIRVSGPRGLGAEFKLRLWPRLQVLEHSMQLVSPSGAPGPSVFKLRLQPGADCNVQPGWESVAIKPLPANTWEVSAPPEFNRVKLEVTTPAQGSGRVRVPISIPLPRPRWGLAAGKDGSSLEWGQNLLHRSIDQVLQAGSAALHIEMYGLGSLNADLKLRLTEISDSDALVQEANLVPTGFTPDWLRASLGQFSATLQHINSMAQFELVYTPRDQPGSEVCIPLLEVSRALDVREVALQPISETSWSITWQEAHPLKNRRVMLRPAWQPWQKPWEYKIPDKAHGEFQLENVALPPSRYHLYFYVLPDYEPALSAPPDGLMPVVLDLCTPQQRLETLSVASEHHNVKFRNLVEAAVIWDDLGDKYQRDFCLSKAAPSLIHLTDLDGLTGALNWIRDRDIDPPTRSFLLNSAFHPKIITTMLTAYRQEDAAMQEYLEYTARARNIPAESAKLLLNRVFHPVAIASCLRSLVARQDGEVLDIIAHMLSEVRLSRRDALDLLSGDAGWALEQIDARPPDMYFDSLLASLLPIVVRQDSFAGDQRAPEWVRRAIPHEKDPVLVLTYLNYLFSSLVPWRFEVLMKALQDAKIGPQDALKMLSQDPRASLQALQAAPAADEHSQWIEQLTHLFPALAGVITRGNKLSTAAGEVIIDYIERADGTRIDRVRISEPGIRINALSGDGADRMRLVLDFQSKTIHVEGETRVWKCATCGFIHPSQNIVTKHSSRTHGGHIIIRPVNLPMAFDPAEIKIL